MLSGYCRGWLGLAETAAPIALLHDPARPVKSTVYQSPEVCTNRSTSYGGGGREREGMDAASCEQMELAQP